MSDVGKEERSSLNFSKAYDRVSYPVLLQKLCHRGFGISGSYNGVKSN